jgi:predicted AlkP superfamily pyrophosphatase or phosphodiesterase
VKKSFLSILAALLLMMSHFAQAQLTNERAKLVVGVVVDQMRYDYLFRYYNKYGNGGFKRFLNQGFVCRNAHYNYVPTETAPGHASVYTGTTPAFHAIVGNEWYEQGKRRYCVEDSTVQSVGSESPNGARSPRNMQVTTLSDQLKLANNHLSKVYAISIKDRGSVLPGGHISNGSFWYDNLTGKFITSTFYMKALPKWMEKFNEQKHPEKYLRQKWETLLPLKDYTESQADDNHYEQKLPGKDKAIFPYNLKEMSEAISQRQLKSSPFELLPYTPFANTYVKDGAKVIITEERLGRGDFTDFLAVSFSSTDIIGHAFGVHSVEIEDTYLRLDKDLEDLFAHLDREVGDGNYMIFLTADHAAVHTPKYMMDLKIPAGYADVKKHTENLKKHLNTLYGEGEWVEYGMDKEIYLNRKLIQEKKINLAEIQDHTAKFMRNCEGIFETVTASDLEKHEYTQGIKSMVQKAYFHKRSPDVTLIYNSGWLDASWLKGGTSHGTPYHYDTHVPMLFYGWKIPKGKNTARKVQITDLVTTVALLLNLQLPDGMGGEPILEIFGEK